jgi:hypothetical protein
VNTRWYSCATPIATTCDRPVAAVLRISGITRSILRSGHGNSASTPRAALVPLASEAQHRDVVGLGEGGHRPAERQSSPLQQRRRRDQVVLVGGEEADHLAADHQAGHRQGQVDPVHAVDLQQPVPIQHIADRDRISPHQT